MRLGFVTTPNTVVFALHFSTGNGDCQLRQGNPGRKARPLVLAEVLNRSASFKKMPCQSRVLLAFRGRLFVVRWRGWIFGNAEARMCAHERIPIALKH